MTFTKEICEAYIDWLGGSYVRIGELHKQVFLIGCYISTENLYWIIVDNSKKFLLIQVEDDIIPTFAENCTIPIFENLKEEILKQYPTAYLRTNRNSLGKCLSARLKIPWEAEKDKSWFYKNYVWPAKVEQRWADKFHALTKDQRTKIIEKVVNKYSSDEYQNREYKKGIEPREELLWVLLTYAEKYGKPLPKDMLGEFVSEAFSIDEDEWIIERIDGQGSFVGVDRRGKSRPIQWPNYLVLDGVKYTLESALDDKCTGCDLENKCNGKMNLCKTLMKGIFKKVLLLSLLILSSCTDHEKGLNTLVGSDKIYFVKVGYKVVGLGDDNFILLEKMDSGYIPKEYYVQSIRDTTNIIKLVERK